MMRAFVVIVAGLMAIAAPRLRSQTLPLNRVTEMQEKAIDLEPIPAADSLYVIGRRALNQSNYDAAAQSLWTLFNRYPTALVAPNALYWYSYAHYRAGVEGRSAAHLDQARRGLLIHRTVYEQSLLRSDALRLIKQVREAHDSLPNVPPTGDEAMAWIVIGCNGPSIERQAALLFRAVSAPPTQAVPLLDEAVMGPGRCLDLRSVAGLYSRLPGQPSAPGVYEATSASRDSREMLIGALGRSIHPSAANELLAIVRTEKDPALRDQAVIWLRARRDPRVEAAIRPGG
jgi:hypothetical protein